MLTGMKFFLFSIVLGQFLTSFASAEMGVLSQSDSELRGKWISEVSYALGPK